MNFHKLCFLAIPLFILQDIRAQVGGGNTYDFLQLTSSARVAALGGNAIAVMDDDPNLAFDNPSLLNKSMDYKMALNYVSYFADINYGAVSFTKHLDSLKGTFNIGMKYIDYGAFQEMDAYGNEYGEFSAGEYAFIIAYGRQLDSNFSVGANLKTIYSSLYDYSSLGAAVDIAGTYFNENSGFTAALLLKNIGSQITSYTEDRENLPFEVQLAASKRFENVPLRLGLTFHHLTNWDLAYENPNDVVEENPLLGAEQRGKNNTGLLENLGRHLIFNAEFLLSKNVNFRLGYNYFRRRELMLDEKLGTVGLSWGFGFRISKFHLSYGRSAFHQAGATNTFSVTTRLSDFVN